MTFHSTFNPPENIELYDLETTLCWFYDGIFWVKTKPNKEHMIRHAKEQAEILKKNCLENDTQQYPIICDVRDGKPLKKEVRDYYSSPESAMHTKQFAFIVHSAVSKVIANFFINQRKLQIPIKMFTDIALAHEWCKK